MSEETRPTLLTCIDHMRTRALAHSPDGKEIALLGFPVEGARDLDFEELKRAGMTFEIYGVEISGELRPVCVAFLKGKMIAVFVNKVFDLADAIDKRLSERYVEKPVFPSDSISYRRAVWVDEANEVLVFKLQPIRPEIDFSAGVTVYELQVTAFKLSAKAAGYLYIHAPQKRELLKASIRTLDPAARAKDAEKF